MGFTRWQWYYNKTQHTNTHITQNNTTLKQNTAHKTPQTIKDTFRAMNKMRTKKKEAIPITRCAGLWVVRC
jgi:hypothetical protein